MICERIRRSAAARTSFSSVTTASPTPSHLLEARLGRVDHLGERAEARDQPLGQLLGVAARQRAEQHELEQLVVGQRVGATLAEALAQALAVARVVRVRAPRERSADRPGLRCRRRRLLRDPPWRCRPQLSSNCGQSRPLGE